MDKQEKKQKNSTVTAKGSAEQKASGRAGAEQKPAKKPSAAAVIDEKKFLAALQERLTEINAEISQAQAAQMAAYYKMLVETNRVMNLTGITEAAEVAEKHVADSLRLLPLLPDSAKKTVSIIDVGTGAGLPGIPLAIACPEARVVLLDSQRKRCDFLTRVCNELGLSNTQVVWGRAEEAAHLIEFRERQSCAVARAVAALPTLLEYLAPFVSPGGRIIAMKGSNAAEELTAAEHAISELNLRQTELIEYQLKDGSGRSLAVLEKIASVKSKYPRSNGQIKKKPL